MASSVVKNALKAIRERGLGNFFRELKEEGYLYIALTHLHFHLIVFLFLISVTNISSIASCPKILCFCFSMPTKLLFCLQIYWFHLYVKDLSLGQLYLFFFFWFVAKWFLFLFPERIQIIIHLWLKF